MHLEDGLFAEAEKEVERSLDGFLLGLHAEELLGAVDLGLVQLEMLVLRHVHKRV